MHVNIRRLLALGTAVLMLSGAAACTKSEEVLSVDVSPSGGTVSLGELVVTVPQGAVAANTKLTATEPTVTPTHDAPLGALGVRFDLSLEGDAQPLKPLEVTIPLAGKFLPSGAKPENALFYTETPQGMRLVPSEVKDGKLYASLVHLSEKTVAYLSEADVAAILQSDAVTVLNPCKDNKATVNNLRITSDDSSGRVKACLIDNKGKTSLHVNNNTNYVWPVVVSSGVTVQHPRWTLDEDVTALFSQWISAGRNKHHLFEGSSIDAAINPQKLPATVKLEANANTWTAETFWKGIKSAAELFVGKNSDELLQTFKLLLVDASDLQVCLRNASGELAKKNLLGKVTETVEMLFSTCGQLVVKLLIRAYGEPTASALELEKYFKKLSSRGNVVIAAIEQVYGGTINIVQQIRGTITIKVDWNIKCPTASEAVQLVKQQTDGYDDMPGRAKIDICSGPWAYGGYAGYDAKFGWYDYQHLVLHWVNGKWIVEHFGGTGPLCFYEDERKDYKHWPAAIRQRVNC